MPCAKCSSRASELPYEQKKFFLVVCPIHAPEKIKRYNPVYSASPAKKIRRQHLQKKSAATVQ